jgi:regulator of sigma E protease
MLTLLAAGIALSLSVLVHEFGHFVWGKLLGARVLKFSIGLGPRILGMKRGETDYCLSWVPFGGYVKFAGMEESENVKNAFIEMPIWKRGLVMFSGPVFNLLLAFIIFCSVIHIFGIGVLKTTTVGVVYTDSPAAVAGLVPGDSITSVAGRGVAYWGDISDAAQESGGDPLRLEVVRSGEQLALEVLPVLDDTAGIWRLGIEPAVSTEVGEVMKDSPAYRVGIRPGDVITSVEGQSVTVWEDMVELIQANPGEEISLEWTRESRKMEGKAIPKSEIVLDGDQVRRVGMIGILMPFARKKLSPGQSIMEGLLRTWFTLERIGLFVFDLFTRKVSPSLIGGPAAIVQLAGESMKWGPEFFLNFFGFLSVNLFVLNLIPLPPLDGGQLVLLVFEGVRRRPLSKMARLVFAQVGIIILVLTMVYVTFNDLMRWGTR